MVLRELKVTNIPEEMKKYLRTYSLGRKKALRQVKRVKATGYMIMAILFLLLIRMQTGSWKYQLMSKAFLISALSTEIYCWKEICSIPGKRLAKRLKKQIPEYSRQLNTVFILDNLSILRKKAYIDKNCIVIREFFLFSDANLKLYLKWKNRKGIFMEKTYLFKLDRFMICETEKVPVYDVRNNYLRIPAAYYIENIIVRKEKNEK